MKSSSVQILLQSSISYNFARMWRWFAKKEAKGDIQFRNTWKDSLINWHNTRVCEKLGKEYVHPWRSANDIYKENSKLPFWKGGLKDDLRKIGNYWKRVHTNPRYFEVTCPETIDRRSNLSVEDFIEEYEKPGIPVIITDLTNEWKANYNWTKAKLLENFAESKFRTGSGFKMKLRSYFSYLETQQDDKPLYLFDQNYPHNAPSMASDYSIPVHFEEDLFKLTKDDRPPWRWILYGPAGSGAPFHIDPRGTSAWNTVIYGKKRWALYPRHIQPPGVGPHDDDYYDAPSSLKWLMSIYPLILRKELKPLECLQLPGETLFLPSGWWHQVYNTEETMAVTHNFASSANFERVVNELTLNRDSFSGLFYEAVKKHRPDLLHIWKDIEVIHNEYMSDEYETESDSSSDSSSESSESSSESVSYEE